MGLTVKGLEHPHRYVLEAAQTHVFLLMKKVCLCTVKEEITFYLPEQATNDSFNDLKFSIQTVKI